MKKTNQDVIVGATILTALLILIGGVLWLKESLVAKKMVQYTAIFPNVGTLQVGDPVMVNGVTKGRVAAIYLRGTQVAAVLNVEKQVTLTEASNVVAQNIGLMGERGVGILLKEGGTPYRPSKKGDTTFLEGSFDTGIAEAMGMLGSVLADVQVLLGNVSSILGSTVGDTSFVRLFHTLVDRLDTLTLVAGELVVKNGPLIDTSMQNLTAASTQLRELLDRNSGRVDAIMANGDSLSSYGVDLMKRLDGLTASIEGFVQDIDSGRGTVGMLLRDEQFKGDLKRTVKDADSLINEIHTDALKLRVRVKLFGSDKKKN